MRRRFLPVAVLTLALLNVSGADASRPDVARAYAAQQGVRALEAAVSMFQLHFGRCPTSAEGLQVLVAPNTELQESGRYPTGGYIRKLPRDAWGNEYQYRCPGIHNPTGQDIWSLGADGRPGGEHLAGDIGNWPGGFEEALRYEQWKIWTMLLQGALVGFIMAQPLYIAACVRRRQAGIGPLAAMFGYHLAIPGIFTVLVSILWYGWHTVI